ncbi:MAG: hypothetical protein AAF481_04960 [Acidobacteriota bacterium]
MAARLRFRSSARALPRWLVFTVLLAVLSPVHGCRWGGGDGKPEPAPPSPSSSRFPDPGVRLFVTVPGGVVLRSAPEGAATVVAVLPREGGSLEVLDMEEPWLRVRFEGRAGWLLGDPSWKRFETSAPPRRPRAAEPVSPEALAAARRIMGQGARDGRCGAYPLLTDLPSGGGADRLLTACEALARELDAAYERRIGLRPLGEPAATLLLFRRRGDFREFSRSEGGPRLGYGAYSRPGLVAMFADPEDLDTALETLVHEITHRIHGRALGRELPRWLSEGLADALGDSAGLGGLDPLQGFLGAEDEASRLVSAVADGRAGSVRRLVHLTPAEFDADAVSFDYEQSALLVRFLLIDGMAAPRFRAYLGEMARGRSWQPEDLRAALGWSWQEWDDAFNAWLRAGGK